MQKILNINFNLDNVEKIQSNFNVKQVKENKYEFSPRKNDFLLHNSFKPCGDITVNKNETIINFKLAKSIKILISIMFALLLIIQVFLIGVSIAEQAFKILFLLPLFFMVAIVIFVNLGFKINCENFLKMI